MNLRQEKLFSGTVRTDWVKGWGTSEVQWQRNLRWKSKFTKKIFQGVPHVFTFEIFLKSLNGRYKAVLGWSSFLPTSLSLSSSS
jgi:hypothetical protein